MNFDMSNANIWNTNGMSNLFLKYFTDNISNIRYLEVLNSPIYFKITKFNSNSILFIFYFCYESLTDHIFIMYKFPWIAKYCIYKAI